MIVKVKKKDELEEVVKYIYILSIEALIRG